MTMVEAPRARRLRITLTLCQRRRRVWARVRELGLPAHLGRPAHYFAKRDPYECPCRKRCAGRPRVDVGMCDVGARDRVYDWRREVRELRAAVRAGRVPQDEGSI